MRDPLYLDFNATTPIHPQVADAMRPWLDQGFGNPSSGHPYGRRARAAVDHAREQLAGLLGCAPSDVIFTGGGTESNNLAIQGVARARRDAGRHLLTSTVEHPAVSEVMGHLAARGYEVQRVSVDATARVDPDAVIAAVRDDTQLISLMHAQNEVGTLNDIAAVAEALRGRGVTLHTDAAQSVGKVPTRVDALGVDLLSVAGHKLYAPKGVGALYIRPGTLLAKILHGADHEGGRRPGTENVLGIVGLGAAAALAADGMERQAAQLQALRDRLHRGLEARLPEGALRLNGHPEARLPNTVNLGFRDRDAQTLLGRMPELAASAGAACHAGDEEHSSVLAAMGVPEAFASGAIRFSLGRGVEAADIDRAIEIVSAAYLQP